MENELKTPFTKDQTAWLEDRLTSIMMLLAAVEKIVPGPKARLAVLLEAIRANSENLRKEVPKK